MSSEKGTTPAALSLAWLLRHPAGIVPIIGATKEEHIIENCAADRVALDRNDWYRLFNAAAQSFKRLDS
jgi:predicted oxidoreductase